MTTRKKSQQQQVTNQGKNGGKMNKNTEDTREFQVMFFYGNTIVTTTPYQLVKDLEKPMEFADEEALASNEKNGTGSNTELQGQIRGR